MNARLYSQRFLWDGGPTAFLFFFFVTTFQRFPLADVLLRPKTVTGVDYLKGDWRNGVVSHPKDGSKNYRVWVPVRCSRVFFYAYMYTIHIIPFFM